MHFTQPRSHVGQIMDEEGRMRLPGGPELRFHTEMDLHRIVLEPHAASLRELGRLRSLGNLEEAEVEAAGLVFMSRRHCELNMVDPYRSSSLATLLTSPQSARP